MLTESFLHEVGYRYGELEELACRHVARLTEAARIKARLFDERRAAGGDRTTPSERTDKYGLTPAERKWMDRFERQRGLRQ